MSGLIFSTEKIFVSYFRHKLILFLSKSLPVVFVTLGPIHRSDVSMNFKN